MASPVPSTQDGDPYADRRTYPRVPIALPAFLQVGDDRHSVHLIDLSAGGAKLVCHTRLSSGTAVILDCGTLGRSAVVRWQNAEHVGLCFAKELDSREINALLNRSNALAEWRKTRE